MKFDARTINLLGLLAIVAVLGLGAVGIVMPLYDGVQSTQSELDASRGVNDNFRMKLIALEAAEANQAEIVSNVEALHAKLPSHEENHTALQIIADALDASGAAISSDNYAPATLFLPRVGATDDTSNTEPAPPADPAAEVAGTGNPDAAPGDPRNQIEVTLSIGVTGHAMASQLLDALAVGPRSLLVTTAKMSGGSTEGYLYNLEVTLLVFFYETGE